MPTLKPRITITLTDHQHEILSGLAHLQKISMSSIVVDLVDTATPVLERVLQLMTAAAKAPQEALEELGRSMQLAEMDVLAMQKSALAQFDSLLDDAGEGGGGARALPLPLPASSRPRKSPEPPPTNRGVRIPSKTVVSKAFSPMKTGAKASGVKK